MANKLMQKFPEDDSDRVSIEDYCKMLLEGDMPIEYDDGRIILMAGTEAHILISENLRDTFAFKLKDRPCRAFSSQSPVYTPSYKPFRIPDVSIVCGRVEWKDISGNAVITNPISIFEVLSSGTEHLDWNAKKHAYMQIETLQCYILIDQYKPVVTIYQKNDSGVFERLDILGIKSTFNILNDIEIPFTEIYKGIEFK